MLIIEFDSLTLLFHFLLAINLQSLDLIDNWHSVEYPNEDWFVTIAKIVVIDPFLWINHEEKPNYFFSNVDEFIVMNSIVLYCVDITVDFNLI